MDLQPMIDAMVAEQQANGLYRVNEIFTSIQGEGYNIGRPATFVRLQGCSVGCPWCDTKYTWPTQAAEGKSLGVSMTGQDIADKVDMPWVVVTGGEPTNWNLDDLIDALRFNNENVRVQIESSGQFPIKGRLTPDWVTWSPKKNLGWDCNPDFHVFVEEIKWVVDDDLTIDTVKDVEALFQTERVVHNWPKIVLMPEGSPPTQEHIAKALEWGKQNPHWFVLDRMQYRFGVR